jgi:hypothetical protein
MEFQIENIRDNLYLKYLNNLKNGTNKLTVNIDNLTSKINELSVINTNSEKKVNDIVTETDLLSENIDYLFLKPWNKINKIHKIIKLKEFVKSLDCSEKDKENLKEELIENIKTNNKFKITYDEKKGRIISIPNLSFSNGKYNIN